MRIEICGGIASGKTTLCALLASSVRSANYENFRENPFWSLFYEDPKAYAFETEVTFLLQHYSQLKAIRDADRLTICDFALLQDRAYAEVNLQGGRLDAFGAVYKQILEELPPPSLIIHLVCGAMEELGRIRRRARKEESSVEIGYLDALNQSVAQRVKEYERQTRVLTINSEENDFANDPVIRERVAAMVFAELPREQS